MTLVDATTGEVIGRTLEECEAVIERGLATFVEVGAALAEVRDAGLYRESHGTFEDYCDQRWGLSRKRAYDLIGAAAITQSMSHMRDTPEPANERQALALAPVRNEPEKAAEAMRAAHASTNGKPTAKAISEAVETLTKVEQLASAAERYGFLADCPAPVREVVATADALDALEPGAERDRRIENARKWADMKRRQAADPPSPPTSRHQMTVALDVLVRWNVEAQRARDHWSDDIDPVTREEWDAALRIASTHIDGIRAALAVPTIRRIK